MYHLQHSKTSAVAALKIRAIMNRDSRHRDGLRRRANRR